MSNKYKQPEYILPSGNIFLTNKSKYMPKTKLYWVYHQGKPVIELFIKKNKVIEKEKVYTTLFIYGCKFVLIKGQSRNNLSKFLEYINSKHVSPEHRLGFKLETLMDEILLKYKTVKNLSEIKYVFFNADSNAIIERILRSEQDIFDQIDMKEKIIKYKLSVSAIGCNKLKSDNTLKKLNSLYYDGCTKNKLVELSGLSKSTVKRYWNRIINYSSINELIDKNVDENIASKEPKLFFDSEEISSSFLYRVIKELETEKIPEYDFF